MQCKSVTHIGPTVRIVFHILQIRDSRRAATVGLLLGPHFGYHFQ
jgi:hypothetical protein